MKEKLLSLILVLSLSACTFSPTQKQAIGAIGKAGLDFATQLAEQAVSAAIDTVFAKATSSEDLTQKRNLASSVAVGIRTLEGTGLVTSAQLKSTVLAFSNGSLTHWNTYADTLVDHYTASPLPTDQKLEILATAADTVGTPAAPNP